MRSTALALVFAAACSNASPTPFAVAEDASPLEDVPSDRIDVSTGVDVQRYPDLTPVTRDVTDVQLGSDAACTATSVMGSVERLPVDIIWMVDNSVSMAPAIDQVIAGLNDFATLIGTRGLDYRVVMLSLRNPTRRITVMGSARYAVCIPSPLAGNSMCGNGPRFFHSSIDIKSTQPLEQILGTLGQTRGYTDGEQRGGEAWRSFLRPSATKTFVLVTDDQSRLSPDDFEHFRGGANPNNSSLMLPPGLLDASWMGMFQSYTFSAIYGWGSDTDPLTRCTYTDRTQPPSSGPAYTTLVTRTRGVRARICDGASTWTTFFRSIASAVVQTSRVACTLNIPAPPTGQVLDPTRINVAVARGSSRSLLGNVRDAAMCSASGGWYYDNNIRPTRVVLCPTSCENAQADLSGGSASIQVQFGCVTIPG
jgi:hypothetical protein